MNGCGNGRRYRIQRRFPDSLGSHRTGGLVGVGKEDLELFRIGKVYRPEHLVVGEQAPIGQLPRFRIVVRVFQQRHTSPAVETAFELSFGQGRIDHRTGVASGHHPQDAHHSGLHIHLDLDKEGRVGGRAVDLADAPSRDGRPPVVVHCRLGHLPDGDVFFRHPLYVDDALVFRLIRAGLQGICRCIENPGSIVEENLLRVLGHIQDGAGSAVHPTGRVGADIVARGAGVRRRDTHLVEGYTEFLGHQLGRRVQSSASVIHQGGQDVDRSVLIHLDLDRGEVLHLPGHGGPGAGGVKAPGNSDSAPQASALSLRIGTLVPADLLRPGVQQLLDSVGVNQGTDGGTLAPKDLSQTYVVVGPQFDRVEIELFRQDSHGRFHAEGHLGGSVALHGAGRCFVRVYRHSLVAHVGQPIEGVPPPGQNAEKGQSLNMMAADIHPGFHLPGGEGAVLLGPDLQGVAGRIAAVVVEILLPALEDLYGFSCL